MIEVILSLTTVSCRKQLLLRSIGSLVSQRRVKKICLNLDNNLSDEDYDFYKNNIAILDNRIEINCDCDPKWRSANKLLPTIIKYPEDIIVTVDDDTWYNNRLIEHLVEEYERNPDCIISHETNPVICADNKLSYINNFTLKFKQKDYSKYLTNCCLFPPHIFDNTDVFDYDKMFKMTDGTNDELWFWENTVIKGIRNICLNDSMSLTIDNMIERTKDEYALTTINANQAVIDSYNDRFNKEYNVQIKQLIASGIVEFKITNDNMYGIFGMYSTLLNFYDGLQVNFVFDKEVARSTREWFIYMHESIDKKFKRYKYIIQK